MQGKRLLQCVLLIIASMIGCRLIGFHRGIHEAVKYGDLARVEELLRKDPNLVNSISEDGTSPLYLAATNNRLEIAELLIKEGAQVDLPNDYGTALHSASDEGHLEMMKLLMKHGADPLSQKNNWKLTPLHFAARAGGHVGAVSLLLSVGAVVNAKDINGRTPLHRAQEKSVAVLLVAQGADVNARDDKGWTCLHWAASEREGFSLETIGFLLEKGADPKLKDLEGKTAAQIARESKKPELANLLDNRR